MNFETTEVDKRIKRAGGQQSTHGKCVICGGAFQTCPHSMQQCHMAIELYNMKKAYTNAKN